MAEALGCYAEYVEEPEAIRPALQRAWREVEKGMVGFVNVKTDYHARATTVRFSNRETSKRPPPNSPRAPQGPLFMNAGEVYAAFSFLAPRRPSRRRHWFAWAGVR
jgi:hypothetical protein